MFKLVLVGAGHALLPSLIQAKSWVEQGLEVHLITADPYLYYSGMMPEYFGDVYSLDEIRIPVKELAEQNGIQCHIDFFTEIDVKNNIIKTSSGAEFSYDLAAFCIGGKTSASIDSSYSVKPFTELIKLKSEIENLIKKRPIRCGIIGGGAAGTELALNISARYPHESLQLSIFDSQERLTPQFPKHVSAYVQKTLKDRNVSINFKAKKERIEYQLFDFLINATGVTGFSAFQNSGLALDSSGFIRVTDFLQSTSHKTIFAAGDCASILGNPDLSKIGIHAVTQGFILRDNLESELIKQKMIRKGNLKPKRFKPRKIEGLILSTGSHDGIWTTKNVAFIHPIFLQLKHEVDLRWILPYQNTSKKLALFYRLHSRHASEKKPILNALNLQTI